jgi:DNA repair protein RadA/Sms
LSTGNVSTIVATIKREKPVLAVIDSVQTLRDQEGGIEQFAMTLIQVAKQTDCALIMVGHVTKAGILAGPKLLEHMVDVVLSFDGDQDTRVLRSSKNRFGSTDEVGLFSMADKGLEGIPDPSAYLCNFRSTPTLGSVIFPSREGMRYVLMEIQALVTPSRTQVPTRSVVGWCRNRLAIILGVLEKYTKLPLSFKDVYLNIVGGMRTTDTATADLAVALAIWSSAKDIPIPPNVAAFGEITLSGDVRATTSSKDRVKLCNRYKIDRIVSHDSVNQIQSLGNVIRDFERNI